MSWTTKLLVIANRTIDSNELYDALMARAAIAPIDVTLVAPASTPGTGARLERAVRRLREAGVPAGVPWVTRIRSWRCRLRGVHVISMRSVVATLPTDVSHWLSLDLPHRIRRLTDARVTHVTATADRRATSSATT